METTETNKISLDTRATRSSILKKLRKTILSIIADSLPMNMAMRANIYRKMGLDIGLNCLIGKINIDGIYPEDIHIGEGTTITKGVSLLTHYYDTTILTEHAYIRGSIHIGKYCYIGMNTIFTKSVTIGDGAVIGAGSIVTKNIPPYEIWAGVPAHFIRRRINSDRDIPATFKPL